MDRCRAAGEELFCRLELLVIVCGANSKRIIYEIFAGAGGRAKQLMGTTRRRSAGGEGTGQCRHLEKEQKFHFVNTASHNTRTKYVPGDHLISPKELLGY